MLSRKQGYENRECYRKKQEHENGGKIFEVKEWIAVYKDTTGTKHCLI